LAAVVLAFAGIQFYLARLNSAKGILAASIIALGTITMAVGYVLFLRRANVEISDAGVVVYDWLGRRRFHAESTRVNLRLVSVREMGIADDFAVLWTKGATGEISAVLLRRVAWGDRALSDLRTHLQGRGGELNFRPISKRALATEFSRLHVQNLPAIAVVVFVILLLAIVISRQ
jgi:hypothetical protein